MNLLKSLSVSLSRIIVLSAELALADRAHRSAPTSARRQCSLNRLAWVWVSTPHRS
jgi:hypothetical protein